MTTIPQIENIDFRSARRVFPHAQEILLVKEYWWVCITRNNHRYNNRIILDIGKLICDDTDDTWHLILLWDQVNMRFEPYACVSQTGNFTSIFRLGYLGDLLTPLVGATTINP